MMRPMSCRVDTEGHTTTVGHGFGGFLDLRENVFLAKCLGAVLPSCRQSFLFSSILLISKVELQLTNRRLTVVDLRTEL